MPLNRLDGTSLRSRSELILSTNSNSTMANVKRARNLLYHFTVQHREPDHVQVTPNSSTLIMNSVAE